jgi:hypothetical protein
MRIRQAGTAPGLLPPALRTVACMRRARASVRTKPGIRAVGTDRVWPSQQAEHGNRAVIE